MNIQQSIATSSRLFRDVVWPEVRHMCGGGTIIPVETVSDSGFAKSLDTIAGVDAWQVLPVPDCEQALRGIAVRVQPYIGFETFTVRRTTRSGAPTEIDKRSVAATTDRGFLTPHLTIHAYISKIEGEEVLSVAGVAKTSDVIAAVSDEQVRENGQDGNTFYWIDFKQVPNCLVWRRPALGGVA